MAGRTAGAAVDRHAGLEEQHLAEFDAVFRVRIVIDARMLGQRIEQAACAFEQRLVGIGGGDNGGQAGEADGGNAGGPGAGSANAADDVTDVDFEEVK